MRFSYFPAKSLLTNLLLNIIFPSLILLTFTVKIHQMLLQAIVPASLFGLCVKDQPVP